MVELSALTSAVDAIALTDDLDLVPTGGSDDHGSLTGHRIGAETCPPPSYERLMALRGDP